MTVEESGKLAALMRARERLEIALASDEGWQALKRSEAGEGLGGHLARLESRLLSNPLFRAWKNVSTAIEDLQHAVSAPPPGPDPAQVLASPPVSGIEIVAGQAHEAGPVPGASPPPKAVAAAAEEASVTFVARGPRRGSAPGGAAQPTAGGGGNGQGPVAPHKDEAEVSVVSIDAQRHADAVERLLKALRGEK